MNFCNDGIFTGTSSVPDVNISRFEMKYLLEPRQRLGLFKKKIDKIHD